MEENMKKISDKELERRSLMARASYLLAQAIYNIDAEVALTREEWIAVISEMNDRRIKEQVHESWKPVKKRR
jgi:hypothetical protein